jgi:hypothetical protein
MTSVIECIEGRYEVQ